MATATTINRTLPVVMSSQSDNDLPSMSWCYAHGRLEDRMGWDCLNGALEVTPGVHPVVFQDEQGETASAIAFIWQDIAVPIRCCGLVVLENDVEAIRYAMQKMLEGKGC